MRSRDLEGANEGPGLRMKWKERQHSRVLGNDRVGRNSGYTEDKGVSKDYDRNGR